MPAILQSSLQSAQVITIGPEQVRLRGSNRIEAEHVILKGDIVTQGNHLKILARILEISPEARIVGFDTPAQGHSIEKEQQKQPSQAARQAAGVSGRAGEKGFKGNDGYLQPGSIEISAAIVIGLPRIDADGESGSQGAIGQRGQDGQQGGRGNDSSSFWGMFRKRKATPGAAGGDGGVGGQGGDGGNGGAPVPTKILYGRVFEWVKDESGELIFKEVLAEKVVENIAANPGGAGLPGEAGVSGRGGGGGQGGAGANYAFSSTSGKGYGPTGNTPARELNPGQFGQQGKAVPREEVLVVSDVFAKVLDAFEQKEVVERKFRVNHEADLLLQSLLDWSGQVKLGNELDQELMAELAEAKSQLAERAQQAEMPKVAELINNIKLNDAPADLNASFQLLEHFLEENYKSSLRATVESLKTMTREITYVKDTLKTDSNAFLDTARLFGSPLFENLTDLENDPETMILPPSLKNMRARHIGMKQSGIRMVNRADLKKEDAPKQERVLP